MWPVQAGVRTTTEPTSFLNTMLSNSSMNTAHYKSPAFDSIMAETLKVTDEAQRTALYTKAEQQLDKDSAIVPVYYYVNARLVKPWVGGYTGKDPLDNTYTRNMYINEALMAIRGAGVFCSTVSDFIALQKAQARR